MISEPTTEAPLPLHVAIQILTGAERSVLADYAFGDSEVDWEINEQHIATGYFSSRSNSVSFVESALEKMCYNSGNFSGDEAYKLKHLGRQIAFERNDELGNDGYYS